MIDLAAIPQDTLIARGQYSTVRAKHEDEKKQLSILCGQFASIAPQVLRLMQPDGEAAPDIAQVRELIAAGRVTLAKIEYCVTLVEGLAQQRAALKQAAWGGK